MLVAKNFINVIGVKCVKCRVLVLLISSKNALLLRMGTRGYEGCKVDIHGYERCKVDIHGAVHYNIITK